MVIVILKNKNNGKNGRKKLSVENMENQTAKPMAVDWL